MSSTATITPSQRKALEVLMVGDAYIEGHRTTSAHGCIVHFATARTLEDAGLAEGYLQNENRPGELWRLRITEAGRQALAAAQSSSIAGQSGRRDA